MNFPNKRILHIKSDDQFISVHNVTEQTIQIVLGNRTSVAWQYIFKVANVMLVKPSPLKMSSLVKLMTNLSIQNFILFLVMPLSPQDFDLRNIKESRGLKLSEFHRALPCTKALLCPLFLVCRKRLQSPSSSLSSKGQIQAVTN